MHKWLCPFAILTFLLVAISGATAQTPSAASTTIFSTGFERSEGYDDQYVLIGQNGWLSFGSGGNGLVTNFFEGFGQQAFIGLTGPTNAGETFSVLSAA